MGAIGFEPTALQSFEVLAGLGWQPKDRNGSQRNNFWTRIGHGLCRAFFQGFSVVLATLCLCLSASAQFVTVNAQLVDGSGANSLTSFLRFTLYNCGSNLPVYSASNLVVVKKQFDLKPNTSGVITGSVVPNDKILCGGVASTLWTITPMKDALTPIQPAQQYNILSSNGIFNLATAMPTNPALAPPGFVVIFGNPTLSQTITQPTGTSMVFLGTFDFTSATVLGLAPSGSQTNSNFSTGTTPCIPFYSGTANGCDLFLQTDNAGNETATSVTASSSLTTPLLNTTGTGYVKVFKTQSTACTAQTGFMCWYGNSLTNQWTCLNSDGSSCNPGTAGGGLTVQTNGGNNTSQATLNFTNPASFNGLTFTFSNPSSGNETFALGGTLNNSGLTNSSTTVNGQTCTLGSSCSITAGGATAIESLTGDGSDGAVTADGTTTVPCLGAPASSTYTMTRDCYFTTLTVNSGVIIKTVSNRILATVSITNSGTIQNSGNAGGAGGNATGTNKATGGTNGVNSITLAAGSLASPPAAIAGKAGATATTGIGVAGTNATAGGNSGPVALTSTSANAGAAGGNSGGSGASGGNNAGASGGTGGTGGVSVLDNSPPRSPHLLATLYDGSGNAYRVMGVNGGGGSGAAGAGDGTNAGGGGGGAGGGGGNGGYIVLVSPTITLNAASVISVSGGAGGNGGSGGTPTTGNCGGGGGGAGGDGGTGGVIARIFNTLTNNGTDTVSGGSAGTGGAAGTGVGSGTNGTAGANGNPGNSGLIYNLRLN